MYAISFGDFALNLWFNLFHFKIEAHVGDSILHDTVSTNDPGQKYTCKRLYCKRLLAGYTQITTFLSLI